ncbi:MAG: exonuclease SbcCD subunit D [Nanoarchaeota archaeon]|nr:exonuclease SbcCD subunit D [Nanoarchaeota archaeon]
MKFAHMGDCHLGGWRQPELRELNFKSFQLAVEKCLKERVEFILISGDLLDSAYPSIETLKEAFNEFRKIKEANIPVFLIAGSHDYSVSGKTFLEVLEKAGFCKNVSLFEERNGKIFLHPTIFRNVALYGYPGKKSGLEVEDIERIKIHDSPGLFKILMLHTTLRDAIGNLPIKAVDHTALPSVDYLALSHLHIKYNRERRVYSGPIFPNSLSELEELQGGSFYIFDNGKLRREELKIKEIVVFKIEIENAFDAADKIISEMEKGFIKDKVVMLKIGGVLKKGKIGDIKFSKIEDYIKKKEAFVLLKSTSRIYVTGPEMKIDYIDSANLEEEIMKRFEEKNPNKNNEIIPSLIRALQPEKLEDEKSLTFGDRIFSEVKKIFQL